MSSLQNLQAPLDPEMERQRVELAAIIDRNTAEDGSYATAIDSLFVSRHSSSHQFAPVLAQPALCIMAQGRKEVRLADETYNYDPLNYLVVSVSVPLSGKVAMVSPEEPILALRLDIDPGEINALIADAGPLGVPARPTGRGLYVERLDPAMLDAVLRLTRLLDTPKDINMLAPLVRREILYRRCAAPRAIACMKLPPPTARAIESTRRSNGSTATTYSRCASMTWRGK